MVEALLQELEGRGVIVLPNPRRGVGPGGVMMIRQRLNTIIPGRKLSAIGSN